MLEGDDSLFLDSYDPPMLTNLRRWAPWSAMGAALVLFGLCWRAYYVGFFNDDAFFIIGARSLLQGRFVELNDPRLPDLVNYLPGYPALLAPLAAFHPSGFAPFQILSILLTTATVGLTFFWARRSFGPAVAWAASLVVALNPLTASLSGTILSDIPYSFFTLLVLGMAWKGWGRTNVRLWLGLGALSGFSFLLRPIGAALGVALVLALLSERRWRDGARVGVAFAAVALPYLIVVKLRQGFALAYGLEFLQPYQSQSGMAALVENWRWNSRYYLNELFVRIWYRWPAGPLTVLKWPTIVVGAAATLAGLRGWTKGAGRFGLIYLAAYVIVHLSWSKQAGRYLLPVLPLIAAAMFSGWAELGRRWKGRDAWPIGAAAVAALLCLTPVSKVIQASLTGEGPLNAPPRLTLDWIREQTPPDAVFGAEMDGSLYILTDRRAVHLRKVNRPDLFMAWADGAGVDHILVASTRFSLKTRTGRNANDPFDASLLISLLEASASFQRVFTSPGEGTAIYRRVRPPEPATA